MTIGVNHWVTTSRGNKGTSSKVNYFHKLWTLRARQKLASRQTTLFNIVFISCDDSWIARPFLCRHAGRLLNANILTGICLVSSLFCVEMQQWLLNICLCCACVALQSSTPVHVCNTCRVFSYFSRFREQFTSKVSTTDLTKLRERCCSVYFSFAIASRLNFSKRIGYSDGLLLNLVYATSTSVGQCFSFFFTKQGKKELVHISLSEMPCSLNAKKSKRRVGREYWGRVSFTLSSNSVIKKLPINY